MKIIVSCHNSYYATDWNSFVTIVTELKVKICCHQYLPNIYLRIRLGMELIQR